LKTVQDTFPCAQNFVVLNMLKLCAFSCAISYGAVADEGLNLLQTAVHKHHTNETLGPIRNFFGAVVSICHPVHKKCIRMNGANVDTVPWTDNAGLPEEAKFTVVDGGLGNLAFWNARHSRYIRLKVDVRLWPPAELRSVVSTERGMCDLPGDWMQERFRIHPGGPGLAALRCDFWGSFLRMQPSGALDGSDRSPILLAGWQWERFTLVRHIPPQMTPGTTVRLRNRAHGSYVRMTAQGLVDASPNGGGADTEFEVVALADDKIALYNAAAGRWLRHHNNDMDSTVRTGALPADWYQEMFDVADAGNGEIALKSIFWGKYVRMNSGASMDSSILSASLPCNWEWERYTVNLVTTTQTTTKQPICEPGASDASDLCNLKSCNDDGSAWNVAKVVCPEDSGKQCPAGQKYTVVAGQCCKECMFIPCKAEGKQGTNVCPAGCTAVDNEDECQLAAKAWKKPFDDAEIPAGTVRPTGCFRNRKFKIKFNKNNPEGGAKGKWPICKQA